MIGEVVWSENAKKRSKRWQKRRRRVQAMTRANERREGGEASDECGDVSGEYLE